jgi:hypothetical protein
MIISVLVPNINGTGNPISGPAQKNKISSISSSEIQTLLLWNCRDLGSKKGALESKLLVTCALSASSEKHLEQTFFF